MLRWKIYYGDGTTFSDVDGTPWCAPARNVQVIVQKDKDHGWHTVCGKDYYVWDDRGDGPRWWAVDFVGLIDYIVDGGFLCIKIGREITNDEFTKIFGKACNDPDFPTKTGHYRREKMPE